ncbi:MAG: hypothetical protein ABIG68_00500 [Acidobacteriota bacterium]
MKFEIEHSFREGWILTRDEANGKTHWIYPKLTRVLQKIKLLLAESDGEPEGEE